MRPLACILAALVAALIAGGVVQVRVGLLPLGRLRRELARVREGREARIPGPQPREVRPLVDEFNLLLDGNTANPERARRNVSNLAHGLKSPLAALATAVEEWDEEARRRLRPFVHRTDRLIRHHLAWARTAAIGGAAWTRVELADAVADHLAALAEIQADKRLAMGGLPRSRPRRGRRGVRPLRVPGQPARRRRQVGPRPGGRLRGGPWQRVDGSIEDDGPGVLEDPMA